MGAELALDQLVAVMEVLVRETGPKKREKRCELPLGLNTKDCLNSWQGPQIDPDPFPTPPDHHTRAHVPPLAVPFGASDLPSLNLFAQGIPPYLRS